MGYVGNIPGEKFTTINKQTLTGDGGTGYTLSQSVGSAQEIEVYVNNVRQEPGVAYTVSGTTLTMTGNVTASDTFYVIFQGKAVNTATVDDARDIRLKDGVKMFFGDGDDLEIYHTGSATLMEDKGTGPFVLRTNGNVIQLDTQFGSEVMGKFIKDGAVELYYDNSKKIETTSTGVSVTGAVEASGDLTIDVSGDIILDADGGDVHFQDNGQSNRFMSIKNSSGTAIFSNPFADGDITFQGNDNGVGVVTPLTLDMSTGGTATFAKNVTITDGNLVVASGHGIDFSATGDASGNTSELLDDYEEGTFSPTATAAGSYQYRAGRYTKIGRIVHIQVEMRYVQSGTTHGSIGGFPFALRETNYLSVFIKEYNSTGHGFHTHMSVGNTSINNLRKVDGNSNTASDGTVYGWGFFLTYETY